MICKEGSNSEKSKTGNQDLLSANSIGKRSYKQRESGSGEGIGRDNNSGMSRRGAEIQCNQRQKGSYQLCVRYSQKEHAEKDERNRPLKRLFAGHARMITRRAAFKPSIGTQFLQD